MAKAILTVRAKTGLKILAAEDRPTETGEAKMGVKLVAAASALAIGFGVLWAGPALTAGAAPAAEQEAQPRTSRADTSRRICRNLVLSGTRLSRRSCRTERAWEEDAEAARRLQGESAIEGNGNFRDGTSAPSFTPR